MITTTFDPVLVALILGIIAMAPCASWFWARSNSRLDLHPADPFFGAVAVVAGITILVSLVILLIMGVMVASLG